MEELTISEKKVCDDVEKYGVHIIYVMEDNENPGFGFSIGLYKTYHHPEILLVGIDRELTHSLINNIAEDIKNGKVFNADNYYPDIILDFDCYFLNVDKLYYHEYIGYAKWFYENDTFPVLQCIYPTKNGVYPWDENWPESIKKLQPLLGAKTTKQ